MGKDFDIQKLKGNENYHTWQFAVTNLLAFNGLSKCIQTVAVAATATTEATTTCAEANAEKLGKAKAIIALSVEQSIYVHISKCNDALTMWKTLQKLYEDNGLSRKIGLLRNLIQCRLEDCDDMQDFIDKIMSTAAKLTGIGFEIPDVWLGAILLAGLTEEFAPMIMSLETNNQEISADAIISKLIDMKKTDSKGEAFACKHGNRKGKQNSKKKPKQRKCYICDSDQHLANVCPIKSAANDRKESQPKKADTPSAFLVRVLKERKNGATCDDEVKSETAFALMTRPIIKRESDEAHENKVKSDTTHAHMVGLLSVCKREEWYIDSGASSHMTRYGDILTDTKNANVSEVATANNEALKVECVGNSRFKFDDSSVVVNDILHIPRLSANLLSVYKMVLQGNTIVFDAYGCKILDKNCKLLTIIKPENGVYKLKAPVEKCMIAKSGESNAMLWHRRFGHLNYGTLRDVSNAVNGAIVKGSDVHIKQCRVCALGKQHRESFPKSSETRTTKILELIHTDLCGPMKQKSLGGAKYMLTFTDDFSRKTFLYFLKEKWQVFKTFVDFKAQVENETECKIKCIRSDNGGEFVSTIFNEFCTGNGIQRQLTCSYTPEQNGVAERANRTIVEKSKCMLFDADLDEKLWAEACNTAAYLMNRTPRVRLHNKTPYEVWTGHKPDVADLRIFGSKVTVHEPKQKRKKWSAKSREMIFIGYDDQKKGFRCYDSATNQVIVSRDVKFFETLSSTVMMNPPSSTDDTEENEGSQQITEPTSMNEEPGERDDEEDEPNTDLDNTVINNQIDITVEDESSDDSKDGEYRTRARIDSPSTPRQSGRTKKQVRPFQIAHFALLAEEPSNVREAYASSESGKWKAAMTEELTAHEQNNTWTLTKLPAGRKPIKTKWVFKVKLDGNNAPHRYKARLVARGYAQKAGIDYDETYSPVVRHGTIRYLMATAVNRGMKIFQMDAITAFLQGELTEEIYVDQPEGFHDGTDRVCRLNRAIYGLKQAGRVWNQKLDAYMIKIGFKSSKCDPCVYIRESLVVAVYVDDFLIFYTNVSELDELRKQLHTHFRMKDIGMARSCLGININQGTNFIELDQSNYTQAVLERFNMMQCKPKGSPSELNLKLTKQMVDETNAIVGEVPYQEAVGCLLYLANATRPDISYATSDVSRFNSMHSEVHWTAVKRILRYLRGTIGYKLRFSKQASEPTRAYCDADWASDIDDRKSRSGIVVILAGGAISWESKKQSVVAMSSAEAEYISLSSTVKELLWLRQLSEEVTGTSSCAKIHCDNESAIKLAQNAGYRPRTKHIDIRLHHIRDQLKAGTIEIEHIPTGKQIADSLTKAVTGEKTAFCANGMGLTL